MSIRLVESETVHRFSVHGFEPIRDNQRAPFVAQVVEVVVRASRPGWIRIEGVRVSGVHRRTETGFKVRVDGTIEPNNRGDAAPEWLSDVARAAGYGQR